MKSIFIDHPHNHKCPNPKCGVIWHHDPATIPNTHAAFELAHKCPECGTQQKSKSKPENGVPQFCCNGARTVPITTIPTYEKCVEDVEDDSMLDDLIGFLLFGLDRNEHHD